MLGSHAVVEAAQVAQVVAGFEHKKAAHVGDYGGLPGSGVFPPSFLVTSGGQPGGPGQLQASFAWSGLSANEMAYVTSRRSESQGTDQGLGQGTGQGFVPSPQELHRLGELPRLGPPPLGPPAALPSTVPLPANIRSCFTQTSPPRDVKPAVAAAGLPAGAATAGPPPTRPAGGDALATMEGSGSPSPLLHNPLLRDGDGATSFGA